MARGRGAMMIDVMSSTDVPTAQPRRLTRSRDDRIIGGVCSGAARYFDIDPIIPRIVLAVLAVFGGTGLAVYLLAWILIPEDGAPSTRFERWLEGRGGDRGRDLLIVLVVLFSLGFLVDSHPYAHRLSGAGLTVLAILAVVVLVDRRRSGHRPARPPSTATYDAPFGPTAAPYGPSPFGSAPAPSYDAPTTAWQPPAAPRERSWLPWLVFGTTLLVAGSFGVVGAAGWANPQPVDVLTACVAVIGLGVLVGAFFGRAWSMIPLGVLLVAALAVANALPRNLTWTAGNRFWAPVGATVDSPYVLGAGDAQLDLNNLPAHQSVTIDSRIGAGRLRVFLPRDATVNLHASTSAGRIEVLGEEQDGTSVDVDRQLIGRGPAPSTINLDVQMGFGDVEITRTRPFVPFGVGR